MKIAVPLGVKWRAVAAHRAGSKVNVELRDDTGKKANVIVLPDGKLDGEEAVLTDVAGTEEKKRRARNLARYGATLADTVKRGVEMAEREKVASDKRREATRARKKKLVAQRAERDAEARLLAARA